MKSNKYLVGAVTAVAALALSSCGSTAKPQGAAPGSGAAANSGTIKMAFVPQIVGIPYYAGFEQGAQKAAAQFGVAFKMSGPSTANSADWPGVPELRKPSACTSGSFISTVTLTVSAAPSRSSHGPDITGTFRMRRPVRKFARTYSVMWAPSC